MMTTAERIYLVEGMSCGHCVAAVSEEVGRLEGVRDVDVDLPTGRLTVRGGDFEDQAVREAVAEAGYEVAA